MAPDQLIAKETVTEFVVQPEDNNYESLLQKALHTDSLCRGARLKIDIPGYKKGMWMHAVKIDAPSGTMFLSTKRGPVVLRRYKVTTTVKVEYQGTVDLH